MSDTKQDAAAIRAELKRHGYNARRVSIRTDYYSLGSSIYATIRDADVDVEKVTKIVERIGKHVRRCEISGDILSGGNTYVHISYTEEVRAELSAKHENAVQAALDLLKASKAVHGSCSALQPVAGFSNVLVGIASNGWAYSLWIGGMHGREFDTAATGSLEIATNPGALTTAQAVAATAAIVTPAVAPRFLP